MNKISDNLLRIKNELPSTVELVAVSKFHPASAIQEAYNVGQRIFGESRAQEFKKKVEILPKDIEWHFIGHLQTNKLKMVLPYASLIHSVDSEKLLFSIDRYAISHNLKISVLLEVFIATESSKSGFDSEELLKLLDKINNDNSLKNTKIIGLMGMASYTENEGQIKKEFSTLVELFHNIKNKQYSFLEGHFDKLSFGMSGDYKIAMNMGANYVRIGTAIFGPRQY
ncbi:MAG: YggS family pyridoxal phosphate-dependent enzyme [Bacteroidales bacterium]